MVQVNRSKVRQLANVGLIAPPPLVTSLYYTIICRESSIEDSCDDLPCSLVLTSHPEGDVVGYARLTRVAGRSDGVLMETGMPRGGLRTRIVKTSFVL